MKLINLIFRNRRRRFIKSIRKNGRMLILSVICIITLISMYPSIDEIYNINIVDFIPLSLLVFAIMNLLGGMPRLKFDTPIIPLKCIRSKYFRVYAVVKTIFSSIFFTTVCIQLFQIEGNNLKRLVVGMLINILINLHCFIRGQFKNETVWNYIILVFVLFNYYGENILLMILADIVYGAYFIFKDSFTYVALVKFYKMYDCLLYNVISGESETISQTQDIMFDNGYKKSISLLEKYYDCRWKFIWSYEISRIIYRKKQIVNQYLGIVLITYVIKKINLNIYVTYFALFVILILGQTIISYYIHSENGNVKNGFYLKYSIIEKIKYKYIIYLILLLFPMVCYWVSFSVSLYSILIFIYIPIQCIFVDSTKNRLKKILIALPFYILLYLSFNI